jgi:hypothetical protein
MSSEDSALSKVLANLLSLYMLTVCFAGAYFNWQYAREHGFVPWLLMGEMVPSAKAMVWPYFRPSFRFR